MQLGIWYTCFTCNLYGHGFGEHRGWGSVMERVPQIKTRPVAIPIGCMVEIILIVKGWLSGSFFFALMLLIGLWDFGLKEGLSLRICVLVVL